MRIPLTILLLLVSLPLASQQAEIQTEGKSETHERARPEALIDSRLLSGLGDTRYHRVDSQVVGRSFHIFVRLPEGYGANALDYPTVYLLDGGVTFPLLAGYYRYLVLAGEIPEAILVGISYGTEDWQNGNLRSTDYTAPSTEREYWGGAARFQDLLRSELFPFLEETYRSDPGRRVVFGQSIGGQFVLFTAQTEPTLFWGHIASNPALHRNLPFFLEARPETPTGERSRLFVSSGSNDDPRFRKPALAWMDHWSRQDPLPWVLETTTLDGHSHFSAAPAAFRKGLNWLFAEDSPPE